LIEEQHRTIQLLE
jgi:chromosome segregation ATPase